MARARGLGAVVVALGAAGILVAASAREVPWRDRRAPAVRGTFVRGAVRFALPAAWRLQRVIPPGGSEGVALEIPCPPLDETSHSANANLLAEPNAGGEDLAAWSARRLSSEAPRRVVEERGDGTWRTV